MGVIFSSPSCSPMLTGDGSGDFDLAVCGECDGEGERVPPIRSLTSLLTSSRSRARAGTGDLEMGICVNCVCAK